MWGETDKTMAEVFLNKKYKHLFAKRVGFCYLFIVIFFKHSFSLLELNSSNIKVQRRT